MLKEILFIAYCGIKRGPQSKDALSGTVTFMQMQSIWLLGALAAFILGLLPYRFSGIVIICIFSTAFLGSLALKSIFRQVVIKCNLEHAYAYASDHIKNRNWILSYLLFFGALALYMFVCFTLLDNYINR